jgi:hypothetical protein
MTGYISKRAMALDRYAEQMNVAIAMATIGVYMDTIGIQTVAALTSEDIDVLSEELGMRMADIAALLSLRDFEEA